MNDPPNAPGMDTDEDAERIRQRSIKVGIGSVVFGVVALVVIVCLVVVIYALVAQAID
jgi:hypothetical protein